MTPDPAPEGTAALPENPYLPWPVRVLGAHREAPDNFTLTLDCRLAHEPGQFVQVSIFGTGEAPISICSYPGEPLALNIREIGRVTAALGRLQAGDTVFVRGPYGRGYPMRALAGNSVFIVGGGCGVAPLRGVIEYIERHRADYRDVTMFLGFRNPDEVLFKRELSEWEGRYRMHVTIDKTPAESCYVGRVGFVTSALQDAPISGEHAIVFVCGPPLMMRAAVEILQRKGFHDDQIFVSSERLMYCAIGKCCHCMIRGKLTCLDGPVFRYDELARYPND